MSAENFLTIILNLILLETEKERPKVGMHAPRCNSQALLNGVMPWVVTPPRLNLEINGFMIM